MVVKASIDVHNHRLWHFLLNDSALDSTNNALAIYALRTLNVTLGEVLLSKPVVVHASIDSAQDPQRQY